MEEEKMYKILSKSIWKASSMWSFGMKAISCSMGVVRGVLLKPAGEGD